MKNSSEKKKSTFFKDFKAFISKGNVLDMAVGVVIGAAFGKIVTGLVNYIINPIVAIFTGGNKNLDGIKTVISEAKLGEGGEVITPEIAILWGSWLQTIIDFLIVALCVFLMLRIVMRAKNVIEADKIAEKKKKDEEAKAKAEEEKKLAEEAAKLEEEKQEAFKTSIVNQEKLLSEIRDLLKNKQ